MAVVVLRVQQEVLGLDISVANAIGVQVVESVEGLAHDESGLGFSQVLALGDEEEKFAALAQLSDQEADALSLPRLMQLYYIWVVESHQNVNLVLERLIVLDLALLHGFDGNFDTCLLVEREVNGAVASRS